MAREANADDRQLIAQVIAFEEAGGPEPDWEDQGTCVEMDPALFYPERGTPNTEAMAACNACPVRIACLQAAMSGGQDHGVWGGTSEGRRRTLRKVYRQAKAAGRGIAEAS